METKERREEILISLEWLKKNLDGAGLLIADCRYDLRDPGRGLSRYLEAHIPGAFHLDMAADLSGPLFEHGGRHPPPWPAAFKRSMDRVGLRPETLVVAYDDDGSGAARLWWLLRYFGHERARILDGGWPGWKETGAPLESGRPRARTGNFDPRPRRELIVFKDDLKRLRHGTPIIDARAPERYSGDSEPLDAKAGHIPGAVNIPYHGVLDKPAHFKSSAAIEELFGEAGPDPVLYCGSGVTACVCVAALASIGRPSRLYAGSWSDWISYADSEIALGQ